MPVPLQETAAAIDFSSRFGQTAAVTGSPAAASETIIATLTLPTDLVVVTGIQIWGWASWTVGTSGTNSQLKIRRTNVSGTTLQTGPAEATAAAAVVHRSIQVLDTAPALTGQVYVLTLTVTAGAATSTVSAVQLAALIV